MIKVGNILLFNYKLINQYLFKNLNYFYFLNISFCNRTQYKVYFLTQIDIYCGRLVFMSDRKLYYQSKISRLQTGFNSKLVESLADHLYIIVMEVSTK